MRIALSSFNRWLRTDDGQDLIEYALLAALIAIVALGAVQTLGNTINGVLWTYIVASF